MLSGCDSVDQGGAWSFVSRPDLRPQALTPTAVPAVGETSPGYVFVAPIGGPGSLGPMILDANGQLVCLHRRSSLAGLAVYPCPG
ncbi:MAG: hypothetical protein ACRDYY_17230 [Acidimicrobiales bacterium]